MNKLHVVPEDCQTHWKRTLGWQDPRWLGVAGLGRSVD